MRGGLYGVSNFLKRRGRRGISIGRKDRRKRREHRAREASKPRFKLHEMPLAAPGGGWRRLAAAGGGWRQGSPQTT